MTIYTYHLVRVSFLTGLKYLFLPHRLSKIKGLIHVEVMPTMILGSPVFSLYRVVFREVAVFAQWKGESDINDFLMKDKLGKELAKGLHLRLKLTRQWGYVSGFKAENIEGTVEDKNATVVAITVARMKFLQIPRFIKWGRPVEKLVRDHPGVLFATASIRFPHTVSTFSIWKMQKDMLDMVRGHGKIDQPNRHIDAMKERERTFTMSLLPFGLVLFHHLVSGVLRFKNNSDIKTLYSDMDIV